MLTLSKPNKMLAVVTALLIVAAIAAFPCVASAMSHSAQEAENSGLLQETTPQAAVAGDLELHRLAADPILGAIIAGVIAGLIVAAITNPSTTAAVVTEAISYVAEHYESAGCVAGVSC